MKAERKRLEIPLEDGKVDGSCSWGCKRGYIQRKDGRTTLKQRRTPSSSLTRGKAAMIVCMQVRLEAEKDGKPCGSASSYFSFLCVRGSKGIEGWKGPVYGVGGKAKQGHVEGLCTELMALLKLKAII